MSGASLPKKKVVLFCPRSTLEARHVGVPLSLLAIGTPPAAAGYAVKIVDGNINDRFLDELDQHLADALCVGITSMTGPQITSGLVAAKFIKAHYPQVPIVWGGFHPTILPQQTLEHPAVDIVVIGQGEVTFLELVERLSRKETLEGLPGIGYKQSGQIVLNPLRPAVDMSTFLPMNYDLVDDINAYIVKTDYADRTLDYLTSYGCPYGCRFCAEVFVSKRRWNALAPQRVLDDIEQLVRRYRINGLRIADNSFFVDRQRTRAICQGLLERNLDITWGNVNGRTDNLVQYDEPTWELMQRSGLRDILIGAESGSQEVLDFIDKGATVEDTLRLKEICSKYGISLFVSTMIGLPYKGPEESRKNVRRDLYSILDLLEQLRAIDNRHYVAIFIYTPFPGTPMYELSIKYGVKEPKSLEEWGQINLNTTHLPWVPRNYEKILEHITQFILLYINVFYKKYEHSRFRFFHRIFYHTARFRLRHRFFALPVEHTILKLYRKAYFSLHQKG